MTKSNRLRLLAAIGPALLAAGAVGASASNAFAATATVQPEGDALYTTQGSVAPQFLANAETIPHFTFQFTDPTNHVTYPITMVGNNPNSGGSITVHTVLIPLKMNFVAAQQNTAALVNQGYLGFQPQLVNHTFDGTNDLAATKASPIYSDYSYPAGLGSDAGQLGDVYMRAQFNKIGTGYHVKFDYSVAPTQTLNVPATKGIAYTRPAGALTGLADYNWFSTQIQSLMGSLQIDAQTIPVFLTDNVLLYIGQGNYLNCCVLGYHGAGMPVGRGAGSANGQGKQPVQTFIYGAYVTPGTYSGFLSDYTGSRSAPRKTRGLSDIHALSHEFGELLDDPFVNNAIRPWKSLTATQYPCTPVLEVGDPVVGVWYGLDGNPNPAAYNQWHPEDLVFAQWFGDGGVEPVLGSSWDGRFTFMGPLNTSISGLYNATFNNYSPTC